MQPQESGFDWWHAASGAFGATIGAISTLLTWVIRAARMEPAIRAEISAAERRMEEKIEAAEKRAEERIDQALDQSRETLLGIREKINAVERDSVRREDFNEFRREYREDFQRLRDEGRQDFADLKHNIVEMLTRRP